MDAHLYVLALLISALRLIGESRGVLDAHCGDFTSALGGDAEDNRGVRPSVEPSATDGRRDPGFDEPSSFEDRNALDFLGERNLDGEAPMGDLEEISQRHFAFLWGTGLDGVVPIVLLLVGN